MKDSKLIAVLQTLSTKELNRFGEYLQSPYFNKNETLSILFEYLKRLAPNFSDTHLISRAYIFEYLYGSRLYDELFLNNILSRLLRLLLEFLAQEEYNNKPQTQELQILKQLRQRKLSDKHINSTLKKFDNNRSPAMEFLFHCWDNFLLHRELDLQFLSKGGRVYNEHLQLKNHQLDVLFIGEKLKIACDMLSRNIVAKVNYNPTFLVEIQQLFARQTEHPLLQEPLIAIYYGILTTIQNPSDENNYLILCDVLYQHYQQFAKEELMDMYGYLLNYCIRQINEGKIKFYEDIWKHYLFLVEKRIIYINNLLPAWEYKNIVTTALRLKKYQEAEAFANQYKSDLPEDIRDNAYNYNLAAIYYGQKQYKKALLMLHNVEFSDATYHLGAKIIQIKSYYELNETDALYSLTDSFSMYLRRNKLISDYIKQANSHFLRFVKKLYQHKEQKLLNSKTNLQKPLAALMIELENTRPIANKDWLLTLFEWLGYRPE